MTATAQLGGLVDAVPLHKVEEELSLQMSAGKDGREGPVRRARMSNLVIFCNSKELAAHIAQAVPAIVAEHPARVLFLIGDAAAEPAPVTASTNVWYPAGGGHQRICSEQVTLRAAGHHVDRLPFAVRGLLIGDLPTNLWWAAPVPPPLAGPFLYDLAERNQQIIYDSIGWTEPARGVAATASWLIQFERGAHTATAEKTPAAGAAAPGFRVAADLNWRRLKYWRRLLAQALDPLSAPGALESITEVLVEHGPHAVIQAWELVSWLASRLHWQVLTGKVNPGTEITWRVQDPRDTNLAVRICRLAEGPSEVRRVRVACSIGGKAGALNVRAENDRRLSVLPEEFEGTARTMNVPPQTLADLVGRQLSDRERDPVFRDSMAVAQIFARSVSS